MSTPVKYALGIDLGTTYSAVGVWQNDRVEIIANEHGNRTTPSYVAFTETERLIGDAAKNQASQNPMNTVFEYKLSDDELLKLFEIEFLSLVDKSWMREYKLINLFE